MDEIDDLQADHSSLAKQWHIMDVTLLASSMISLMGSVVLALYSQSLLIGFGFTFIPSALTLPITLLTLFIYRKTRLPSRFELPAAISAGGIAFPLISFWVFSE